MIKSLLELNIEMSPSPSSTARSLIEAFDLDEASDPLQVDHDDEGAYDSGRVPSAGESPVATAQAGSREGRPMGV